MKTKKKTYVLLVLVLAVWGTVAYKIISALNPDLPEIQQHEFAVNSNYSLEIEVDTFSISEVNRDPFLGTFKKTPKANKPKRKLVQWKSIQYQGIIEKGKDRMFIVSISGNQYLMRKGHTKDSVTLIHGNSNSISMRYKNITKSFSLKHKK